MSLTDIEKAVVELSSRHPGLTKEFLRTLLEASGWEEKHIKEAQIILSARLAMSKNEAVVAQALPQLVTTPSTPKEDITFFRPDGTEEGKLIVPENVSQKREEEKVVTHKQVEAMYQETQPPVQNLVEDETQRKGKSKEDIAREREELSKKEADSYLPEESLIREIVEQPRDRSSVELPENLPLVPFESSPHVWSFGRYKDTFHRDENVKMETKESASIVSLQIEKPTEALTEKVMLSNALPTSTSSPSVSTTKNEESVEVDFEKTPITKGDESLVVLAGVMLLAIMLILGYMYSNGRL